MSNHVHHVRGRLRVRLGELKGCSTRAESLRSTLAAISGVTHVECRSVTGSVIVHYHPGVADTEVLFRVLGCDRPTPIPKREQPAGRAQDISSELRSKLLRAAVSCALEKAVEHALAALLAAVL